MFVSMVRSLPLDGGTVTCSTCVVSCLWDNIPGTKHCSFFTTASRRKKFYEIFTWNKLLRLEVRNMGLGVSGSLHRGHLGHVVSHGPEWRHFHHLSLPVVQLALFYFIGSTRVCARIVAMVNWPIFSGWGFWHLGRLLIRVDWLLGQLGPML